VIVDAGTDEKEPVQMGSEATSYPVTTWSKAGGYHDVLIEFSQDCTGIISCHLADVDFSGVLPGGVVAGTGVEGKIVLTGDYSGINEAMQRLIIAPGSGNPSPISVKVTATDQNGVTTDVDSFTIPVVSVSAVLCRCFHCLCHPI
jgi:hypothetical protein